jgi:hypothetical protein
MRTTSLYLACAVLLVSAAAGYAELSRDGADKAGSDRSSLTAYSRTAHWIELRMRANGLYPGARKWAPVKVRNLTRHRLTLRSIRPRVLAGTCSGRFHPERRKFKRRLPPHSKRRVKLRISMDRSAGNRCQDVKVKLRLRARATLR